MLRFLIVPIAVIAALSVLVAGCDGTPVNDSQNGGIAGTEYRIRSDGSDQLVVLTLGTAVFEGTVRYSVLPAEDGSFSGTVTPMGTGLLRLTVTASESALMPVAERYVAAVVPGTVLFLLAESTVDAAGLAQSFMVGLNQDGACLTGGEAYNVVAVPGSPFDRGTDLAVGLLSATAAGSAIDLQGTGYTLSPAFSTTGSILGVTGLSCPFGDGLMTHGTTENLLLTAGGFAVLGLYGVGGYLLLPPPPADVTPAEITVPGRGYVGALYFPYDDGTGTFTLAITLVTAHRATAAGSLEIAPIANPATEPPGAAARTLSLGASEDPARPSGFLDASLLDGQAAILAASLSEGRLVLSGLFEQDNAGAAGIDDPRDWGFLILRQL